MNRLSQTQLVERNVLHALKPALRIPFRLAVAHVVNGRHLFLASAMDSKSRLSCRLQLARINLCHPLFRSSKMRCHEHELEMHEPPSGHISQPLLFDRCEPKHSRSAVCRNIPFTVTDDRAATSTSGIAACCWR